MRQLLAVLLVPALFAKCIAADGPAPASAPDAVAGLRKEIADKGWIVFAAYPEEMEGGEVSKRNKTDLYISRPDGTHVRNITRTGEYSEFGGRFSPDGKKLLFRRSGSSAEDLDHGHWGRKGDLVIAESDGSNPVVWATDHEQFPWACWSPDGRQISCLYRDGGTIRIFDVGTKKLSKEMTRHDVFQQLFWSPDGKQFVGTGRHSTMPDWGIVTIDIASEKVTPISRGICCTPDWFHRDATRLLYSNRITGPADRGNRLDKRGTTVLMQATADGAKRTLVYGRKLKHAYYGCTSPDEKYVIFGDCDSDEEITEELHLVRLADTPIVVPQPDAPELKERFPNAKDGPVLDLKLPGGQPISGFEPHWTGADLGGK